MEPGDAQRVVKRRPRAERVDVRLNGKLDIAVQVVERGVWKLHLIGACCEEQDDAARADDIEGRAEVKPRRPNDDTPGAAAEWATRQV